MTSCEISSGTQTDRPCAECAVVVTLWAFAPLLLKSTKIVSRKVAVLSALFELTVCESIVRALYNSRPEGQAPPWVVVCVRQSSFLTFRDT
uniref:Uncharacterized protein n=1 Tax=Trichuris muris TaxID=70415 RepID=A0A5S6QEH1_TRIMR